VRHDASGPEDLLETPWAAGPLATPPSGISS
jgi:hypothetical protein